MYKLINLELNYNHHRQPENNKHYPVERYSVKL